MDTGSTGIVVSQDLIPNIAELLPAGTAGQQTYTSSGRIMNGVWVTTSLAVHGADGTVAYTQPMQVLAVTSITCQEHARDCTPSAPGTAPTGVAMMGIGFGREHDSQPQGTPDKNPFLNLVSSGAERRGYVVTREGVYIGLTSTSAAGSFTYVKLVPDATYASDWQGAPVCISVNSGSQACGASLVDTGVTIMYLTAPVPASSQATQTTQTGASQLVAADGTVLSFYLPGNPAQAAYSFTVGGQGNPMAPGAVYLVPNGASPFVNTSVLFLNGFDLLYDADGGFVGYRWTGNAPSGTGSVTPMLSLTGSVALPNGFATNFPTALTGSTTLVPLGTASFAGVISGNAALSIGTAGVGGTGVLLSGANTYSGGTSLLGGTLAVGNSAALGTGALTMSAGTTLQAAAGSLSLANAVTLAGPATFNSNGQTLTMTGLISGSGSLTKIGTGTLVLTADNTFTGGTTVQTGTLQLGNGGTSGNVLGPLVNNATVVFNRSDRFAFPSQMSGSGDVIVEGGGTPVLSSNTAHSGSVTVNNGAFIVNASTSSTVVVNGAGSIGGSGSVGGLVANAGATVSPGNSIGTLSVMGNVSLGAGSNYVVEVNGSGAADRLTIGGQATLGGGALLVLPQAGAYALGTTYTILTAAGGLSGTFGSLSFTQIAAYPFLGFGLSYDAGSAYLAVTRNAVPFASAAASGNHVAVANAVDSLPLAGRLATAVAQSPTVAAAQQAFTAMSGDIHASTAGVLLDGSRFVRDAVLGRLMLDAGGAGVPTGPASLALGYAPGEVPAGKGGRDGKGGKTALDGLAPMQTASGALWGQAFGSWGRTDATANAASLDRTIGGFFLGADGGLGDIWRFGAAGGFSQSSVDADAGLSSAQVDSYYASLYGGARFGAIALRFGAAYAWHDISTGRTIVFPGFADGARGDYRSHTAQVFGEAGYRIRAGSFDLEPFAGLAYVNLSTDSFAERGGPAALYGLGGDQGVTYSTLGIRAASVWHLTEAVTANARATIGWRHAFDGSVPTQWLAFAGGAPFQIQGAPIAENALVVDLALGANLTSQISLSIAYSGQIARNVQDHGVKGDFVWRF